MLWPTPDDKGCITVKWPSQNVPYGGVFHSQKATHHSDTAQFLKVLLDESKLDTELRKRSTWVLRDGSADVMDRGKESRRQPATSLRPQTSRRRSLSSIRESGALDVDSWRPLQRGEDRESLKQRLQELMEWGGKECKQKRSPVVVKSLEPPAPVLPTDKDMRQVLLTQIRERAEWLEDMERLGHAAPHRELIRDQIAERMRSLAALQLDSERSADTARDSRGSDKGSQRGDGSVIGSARTGATGARAIVTPGTAHSSARSAVRSTGRGLPKKDVRSASVAPPGRRAAEENVGAYVFSPVGRSPRRRS